VARQRRYAMTADKLLNLLFNAGVVVSIGATVLALGMSYGSLSCWRRCGTCGSSC
jgi:hypothetical protein